MSVDSQASLIEALARGDFEAVVGTPESEWVDFKQSPYNLDSAKDQWELAKDVAAFAESRGGLLVIGYECEKPTNSNLDTVKAHHPNPRERINVDRYLGIIGSRVYPPVAGIKPHWFPPSGSADAVFVLEVPAQADHTKPFLVTRMPDETGQERAHFVGMPRRDGDRVTWLPPGAIQQQISLGRRPMPLPVATGAISDEDAADELAKTVEAAAGESSGIPYVSYQTFPTAPRPEPRLSEQLLRTLEDPPSLRSGGFNLGRGTPSWLPGGVIEHSGRSLALRVKSDGLTTLVLMADRDGLGWALSQYLPEGPVLLNPLTLAEETIEFFRLLDLHVGALVEADHWTVSVRAQGMKSGQVYLVPGPWDSEGFPVTVPGRAAMASGDDWEQSFVTSLDPEADAYHALVRLYALWDLPPDAIPFTSGQRITSDEIARQ